MPTIPTFVRMKMLLIAATEKEISLLRYKLNPLHFSGPSPVEISFHVTGVGMLAAGFSIAELIYFQKPDFILQVGIAGTFDDDLPLGKVFAIKVEYIGDAGVVENNMFKDLFDLELQDDNNFPFTRKKLTNTYLEKWNVTNLPIATAITVNEITTRQERILQLKEKYNPAIESMEGASLHYCCLKTNTPFMQIRATSNRVGERDKRKWEFNEAFKNISVSVADFIQHLNNIQETT